MTPLDPQAEICLARNWPRVAAMVARIVGLIDGAELLPRAVRNQALRLIRPAEAMVRRLLVLMAAQLDMADALLTAVGQVVRLDDESQMDAVTGVSGSGPAYVFHLIETLAAAGVAQGLPADLAMRLAKATVAGAGALAEASEEDPGQLRVNVTSPAGTTAAALEVLMDEADGFPALLARAVRAATDRSRALAG